MNSSKSGTLKFLIVSLAFGTACTPGSRAVEREARTSLRASLGEQGETVRARYEDGRDRLLWVGADGLTRSGRRMVETIRTTSRDGLDADAYGVADALAAIERSQSGESSATERGSALAEADLSLTRGYVELVRDLRTGTAAPSALQPEWEIQRTDLADADLAALVLGRDPEDALRDARPATAEYARLVELRDALENVRANGGWPSLPDARISIGDRDSAVVTLRARLMASIVESEREDAARGDSDSSLFDEDLERALRSFQQRHALAEDGALGANTVVALNVPVEERIRTVEINLERWRWMPHSFGERVVLVNVAGFVVHLLENDRSVLEMNAVVGKAAWPTPVFSDTMTHMIVNPYWNVPESILTEEVLPNALAEDDYLASNNYEVVDGDGQLVDADVIDDDNFVEKYRIRQRPGAGNALGRVKFMFPNQNAVYLHDTPSKSFFAEPVRAFSHGCVRVEKPLELARFLMEWTGGDRATVDDAFATDETAQLDLPRAVPVYLAYLTVWVGDDGRPRFFPDSYGQDRAMIDRLVNTPGMRIATAGRVRNTGD